MTCDQYPYTASSTGLSAVLPKWAWPAGGSASWPACVTPPPGAGSGGDERARPDWGPWRKRSEERSEEDSGWHHILIARCRGNPNLEGRPPDEIAERKQDGFEVCFDLLIQEDGYVGCVFFSMCEPDVRTVMRWPGTMIGSDALLHRPYGTLGEGKPPPRAYGTFARVLGPTSARRASSPGARPCAR